MTPSCDFINLAAPGVRTLHPYQPGMPESELRRQYGITEIVKLASNENPLGPSPHVLAALPDVLKDLARYPDGNGFGLKSALSDHHQVATDCITLGNGSNDVLELIARAFLTSQQNAVFSKYAFAVYPLVTQAIGAKARIADAHPADHVMPYGHDLDAMRDKIDALTRVIFIANPNNPTGTWLHHDELEAFLWQVPPSVIVVVDEAYAEYVVEDSYPDTPSWLERFPNLIVTRTFSKVYGLAGLRVGYALAHPTITNLLNRVRQPFNVNSVALVAATFALSDSDHVARSRQLNHQQMQIVIDELANLGLTCLPSIGNFLCVDMKQPGRAIFEKLLYHGVIVRPVDNYRLTNYLRITIGLPEENQKMLSALQEVLTT